MRAHPQLEGASPLFAPVLVEVEQYVDAPPARRHHVAAQGHVGAVMPYVIMPALLVLVEVGVEGEEAAYDIRAEWIL